MSVAPTPDKTGKNLAVRAESLFLINLLLLPGLAFVLLLVLWWRHRADPSPLARNHLQQTVVASLWAGSLLVLVNGLIIVLGGYQSAATWVIVILYFVTCHAVLVLLGALGLSKALAGQRYRFPLIGPRLEK
ncbi:MAG: hypothetical protein R3F53_00765 [Gammaproteobacteria bacterium]